MKNKHLKSLLITSLLAAAGFAFAGNDDSHSDHDVLKHVIKIEADTDSDVRIFVDKDGVEEDFSFDMDELDDMDDLSGRLDSLDDKTKNMILNALSQIKSSKGHLVHFNDVSVEQKGEKKEIVIVKSGLDDSDLQVEVNGDGEFDQKRFHVVKVLADGEGFNPAVRKHVEVLHGGKRELSSVIKRLIKKADLTPEQIEELRSALDEKY